MTDLRPNLVGMPREALTAAVESIGEKKFRVKQLWHWLYHRGSTNFDEMATLPKTMRAQLAEHFTLERPVVTQALLSTDGTRKWLIRFNDGNEAEMVFIPDKTRGTLCISSQVGCTMKCSFCHTGTQPRVRDLTSSEIVGQLMLARDELNEWPSGVDGRLLTNVVLMGMGEPLMNFESVKDAVNIIKDGDGLAISKRRVVLSTSGVVPMMQRCGDEIDVDLAVSLHSPRDEVRDILVPINRKYPIDELLNACAAYPSASNSRRITMEYVMLKGINDSPEDALLLARLMRKHKLPAKFNLIPFNPWPGSEYECSSNNAIHRFSEILNNEGFSAPVRKARGADIMAACGQLKSASENVRAKKTAEPATA